MKPAFTNTVKDYSHHETLNDYNAALQRNLSKVQNKRHTLTVSTAKLPSEDKSINEKKKKKMKNEKKT